MKAIGFIADISSIIGLGLSIFVAIEVRKLSRNWLFAGRVSDHKRQLSKSAQSLNTLLASSQLSYGDFTEILVEIKSTLFEIGATGPRRLSKSAKRLSKQIERKGKALKHSEIGEFCESLRASVRQIEADLNQEIKNRKISPRK